MSCLICHRSISARAKKCSACGAPTNLSKGDFIFALNAADEKQLNKYYQQWKENEEATESEKAATVPENKPSTQSNSTITSTQSHTATVAQTAQRQNGGTFLESHGLTILKGTGYFSIVLGVLLICTHWKPLLILEVIAILASGYLIFTQLCYNTHRSVIFGVCAAIFALSMAVSFINGYGMDEAIRERIQHHVDSSQNLYYDVKAQLEFWKEQQAFPCVSNGFMNALFVLNLPLVRYEERKTKFRLIVTILGTIVSIFMFSYAMNSLGYYITLTNEIAKFLAN